MRNFILFVSALTILSSCELESQRQALDKREQTLNAREIAVLLKEKELKLLEDSLYRIVVRKDSLNTLIPISLPLPDSLSGRWDVNMLCTKTSCSGAAVGDTRKEQWLLANREDAISVQAFQKAKLIRVYTGTFSGTSISLTLPPNITDSLAPSMTVDLKIESPTKMSGERTITQTDGCITIFKIDMNRASDKKQ